MAKRINEPHLSNRDLYLLDSMEIGQRYEVAGTIAQRFPTAPFPREDDHMEPSERLKVFCDLWGLRAWENFEKQTVVFEKIGATP
jgi:hypothetical protein